jgi:hypothetical protein
VRALRRAEAVLRRPLRLAVVGESNTGKSALTNLLLGLPVLPTLQISNTRVPTLIRYGDAPRAVGMLADGAMAHLAEGSQTDALGHVQVQLPLPALRSCEIVDFPGFFDPLLGYDGVDMSAYRLDAAIWCTFSTQAWKESERSAWRRLPGPAREYGLLAVTNTDRLRDNQGAKISARLEKVARPDFRDFVLLSSLKALGALSGEGVVTDGDAWLKSGAAELHQRLGKLLLDLRLDRLRKAQAFTGAITARALSRLEPELGPGKILG